MPSLPRISPTHHVGAQSSQSSQGNNISSLSIRSRARIINRRSYYVDDTWLALQDAPKHAEFAANDASGVVCSVYARV